MSTDLLMSEATLYGRWRSGVGRYARHIAEAASEHYGSRLAVCSPRRIAPSPSRWIPTPRFRGSGRLRLQDAVATSAAALLKPRLYYGTYYGVTRTSAPQVFTVYDLIHDIYAPARHEASAHRFLDERRRCLERASALIAISHNTAADVVRIYPQIDAGKIVVTHLGVDELFFGRTRAPAGGRPYFLFVGTRAGIKNFPRLIEAFAATGLQRDLDLLVVSPGNAFTGQERDHIRSSGVAAAVELRTSVEDGELAQLYADSVALVYPSEYEGFGLPILEAMAAGTLVASSNTSSMPEAGGSVPYYFDPKSTASMAETLRSIAGAGREERALRTRDGVERARTFTWSRCTSQTLAVFDQLIAR